MFSLRFMLFPTLQKKIGVMFTLNTNNGGGGGGIFVVVFFVEKQFFLISRFMLFSTLKENIEKCPFTYRVKWEVVSPNSREGHLESIYIISFIPRLF